MSSDISCCTGPASAAARQNSRRISSRSAFLMPRAAILAAGLQHATLSTIINRKAEWRVSAVALIYRLHAVGVLTDWQYRSLYIEASKKGLRSNEPKSVQRETSQVLEKVLDHLRTQGLSRREIAKAVHLNVEDFDRLVSGSYFWHKRVAGRARSQLQWIAAIFDWSRVS